MKPGRMENVSISSQASNEFYSLWQNRHFDSCVEELQRLERGNPQDPKVGHWRWLQYKAATVVNAVLGLSMLVVIAFAWRWWMMG